MGKVVGVEQLHLFSEISGASNFIFLQIENGDVYDRMRTVANWYVESIESGRVLIVSWLPTSQCNISITSLFEEYPSNLKIMLHPLPEKGAGIEFLRSICDAEGLTFICLDDELHLYKNRGEGVVSISTRKDMLNQLFSTSRVIYVHDSSEYDHFSTEPCLYRNFLRAQLYTQLKVRDNIARTANKLHHTYFQHGMLIGIFLSSNYMQTSEPLNLPKYLSPYLDLMMSLWKYFSYTEESELSRSTILEAEDFVDNLMLELDDASALVTRNESKIVFRRIKITRVKRVLCWVKFLISSDDYHNARLFISTASTNSEWNTMQQSYSRAFGFIDSHNRTVITVEDVTVLTEVDNPLVMLEDSRREGKEAYDVEAMMVEWILFCRISMLISTNDSVFANEISFSQSLSPSLYELSFESDESVTAVDRVSTAALIRQIPVILVVSENVSIFQDIGEYHCGIPVHFPLQAMDKQVKLCSDESLPWDLNAAQHHIHCLEDQIE